MRQRRNKASLQKAGDRTRPLTRYEERMAACEAAWREGEVLAIAEAATWTKHQYQLPPWFEQAIIELAIAKRSDKQAQRHAESGIHLMRYMTVRDLKIGTPSSSGRYIPPAVHITWDNAYDQAAKMLAGTPAAGAAPTMKKSYAKVRRELDAGHAGRFFTLKDRRYRRNGRPDRSLSRPNNQDTVQTK